MSLLDTIDGIIEDDRIHAPSMQSLIAGTLTVVVSLLWMQGLDVPEGLLNVYLIVIGFFFGDRMATNRAKAAASTLPDPVSG